MKITPIKYAKALVEALESAPKAARGAYIDNFLAIVEKNNDLKDLPSILKEIKKIEHDNRGIKNVMVTTAVELSQSSKTEISKKMEKVFSSKVEIAFAIDPSILGGVVIESGEEIFDKSVISYLNKFKHHIIN